MYKLNINNPVSFNGSYIKKVENPSQLMSRENLNNNNYLMRDFKNVDGVLMNLAAKLGDNDTVELSSRDNKLELIVQKNGKTISKNLGLEEGLYSRVCKVVEKISGKK